MSPFSPILIWLFKAAIAIKSSKSLILPKKHNKNRIIRQNVCTFLPFCVLFYQPILHSSKTKGNIKIIMLTLYFGGGLYMVFHNYEYFVAIVESGSLTKAAEKLYVSQPSLSQYVKRLEANLGVTLFDRSTSPLRLTYTGERYYQYVLQLMKLDENVRKEFQDIKNETSGRLRLGVALWRGACLLPDVFPSFHRTYPNIHLELTEGRAVNLENALMNDKIDLAVMNLPRMLDYNKLTCEVILEERILLAAPTQHPYVRSLLNAGVPSGDYPVAPPELLTKIPLILTKPGQNLTHEVNYMLNKQHIQPDILLETDNLTTAINLTARGIACTFVPEEGAKICQHPGLVTYFTMESSELIWDLAAVYQKDSYLTHLSRLFIDAMKQQLQSVPHCPAAGQESNCPI